MYAEERRHAIADLVRSDGRGDVAELAERFDVTPETVRRDLIDLERRGVLRRVHGGALAVSRLQIEPAVGEKARLMQNEKKRIARAALALVPRGGTMILDAGTTTGALAAILPHDLELTVVTNSLPNAMSLSTHANVTLQMIGGRVRGRTLANVDDWAMKILSELKVDVSFVAANGVSGTRGLSTADVSEAAVKRAMVAAGDKVVLLADHTKIGQEQFARFAEINDIDTFVTDRGAAPTDIAALKEAGIEVVVA